MSIALFRKLTIITLPFILATVFFLTQPVFAGDAEIPYLEYSNNDIYFYKSCDRNNRSTKTGATANASGSTADEKIWSALKSLGLSDEIAAGILGNIHNEGGASPARREGCFNTCTNDGYDWENDPSKAKGLGLIQWSFGRRVNLIKHLREKGAGDLVDKYLLNNPEKYGGLQGDQFIAAVDKPDDADKLYALEVDFLVEEIKTNNSYKGVLDQTTAKDAAEYFSMHVEQCRECVKAGSQENQERIAAAEAIYQQFTGKSSFSSSSNLSPCDCDDGGNLVGGIYAGAKYNFTDEELKRLWWAATAEEGSAGEGGIKTELSIFANIYEQGGGGTPGTPGNTTGLIAKVTERYHNGGPPGWFAETTGQAYETGEVTWPDGEHEVYPEPTTEQINIAKDILNNGHRTIPPQIVEHDGLSDITSASNNGVGFDKDDRSQYKSGVTTISALGDPYIFYVWANGEKVCSGSGCGDPFGYFEDNPPSTSALTTTETSSITWTDEGWLEGGLDGFTKEDGSSTKKLSQTANQVFTTDMPNTKGKGPTKITITATESPEASGTSGLELFKSKKESKPPHFTIDLANKKVYQHFPLYKTSGANTSTDDGLYIAVIGYTDADKAKQENNEKWDINKLTDSDYNYLAELIRGISSATGIDFTNLAGPDIILTSLQKSLTTSTTSECSSSGATGNIIADTALELSWDCGESSGCHSQGSTPYEPKPEYLKAMESLAPKGTEPYDNPGGWGYGASCDRFVAIVMRYTKADENFPTGYANDSGAYMEDHPELYQEIPFDGSNFEVLQPGDIFSTYSPRGQSCGHIWIYVTINGEHGRADASNGNNSGRTAEHYTKTPIIHDNACGPRTYKVFRKK